MHPDGEEEQALQQLQRRKPAAQPSKKGTIHAVGNGVDPQLQAPRAWSNGPKGGAPQQRHKANYTRKGPELQGGPITGYLHFPRLAMRSGWYNTNSGNCGTRKKKKKEKG